MSRGWIHYQSIPSSGELHLIIVKDPAAHIALRRIIRQRVSVIRLCTSHLWLPRGSLRCSVSLLPSALSTTTTSADSPWPVSTTCRSSGPCKCLMRATLLRRSFLCAHCATDESILHLFLLPCVPHINDFSSLSPSPAPASHHPHHTPPYDGFILNIPPPPSCQSPLPVACTPTTCSVTATWPGCRSGCDSAPVWVSILSAWPRLTWGGTTWPRCRRRSLSAQVGWVATVASFVCFMSDICQLFHLSKKTHLCRVRFSSYHFSLMLFKIGMKASSHLPLHDFASSPSTEICTFWSDLLQRF